MDSKNEYKTHGFWDKTLNIIMNKLITFILEVFLLLIPRNKSKDIYN